MAAFFPGLGEKSFIFSLKTPGTNICPFIIKSKSGEVGFKTDGKAYMSYGSCGKKKIFNEVLRFTKAPSWTVCNIHFPPESDFDFPKEVLTQVNDFARANGFFLMRVEVFAV